MPKFKEVVDVEGSHYGVRFICPGCKMSHVLPTQYTHERHAVPRWHFNGDYDAPVLSPSIAARGAIKLDEPDETKDWDDKAICHSFVGINGAAPGEIIFLSDCTHALAGQVVPLPEMEL